MASMPKDRLLTIGKTIIEACFAWECRHREIDLAFRFVSDLLMGNNAVKVVRAPRVANLESLYEGVRDRADGVHEWAINNPRPAFDVRYSLTFSKVVIGQLSNVTFMKGAE